MRLLAIIAEQDVTPGAPVVDASSFARREAVRAVMLNEKGQVALLRVGNRGYHKLPGGGIDEGEDRLAALERELLEEIGCRVEVTAEVGKILEYRDEWRQLQTSFCYLAKQIGKQRSLALTQEEQDDGFEAIWVANIAAAIALLEADRPVNYDGRHIVPRDIAFLKAATAML